ncbi:DUF4913 domain-containing protein [Cellulomonas carbonis]|uniref:DUF4913 domain-containing protein n=1 Tax=Cellulomonas carbonis TaxID=1386092 RepID=UPI00166DE22E|nr:DUF4913 domain-containing protein [Cellulomonas carbonis]GGC17787.1 hypothetical protein GCM10010972_33770 [Cellulomonas carbonis]
MSDWGADEYDEPGIQAEPVADDRPLGAGHPFEAPADNEDVHKSAPTLYFGSVDEFVREYLRNVYRRKIAGDGRTRVWAAEWWKYDEAVIRLEALWRAWEHLRQEPTTGMSVWWRDHADHHMAMLMDPDGPFAGAEGLNNSCKRGEPLPYAPPPAGMFADVRASRLSAAPTAQSLGGNATPA